VPIDIRPVSDDEFIDFARVDFAAFGGKVDDRVLDSHRPVFEADRSLAAFEGDRLVGTAGSFSFEVTLPGLASVPAAAVSYVGVLPTHRRRGVLSALMRCQLDDVRRRGEPLAVLTASEAGIYGRFGYGPATYTAEYELRRREARLGDDARAEGVELVEGGAVPGLVAGAYESYRRAQVGEVSRTEGWWRTSVEAIQPWADQDGSRFFVVHRRGGEVDGYASYRFRDEWTDSMPDAQLTVSDLWATNPQAEAALVSYLLSIDLVAKVKLEGRPVEDPLRWRLVDGRQLRTRRVADHLWCRPVDAAAALAARRYRAEGELCLEIRDELCPWNEGHLVVEGGPDGASCRYEKSCPADLALGPAELGSVLLGGVRPSSLARAGRLAELRPGALARADLMLGSDPAPWCGTEF